MIQKGDSNKRKKFYFVRVDYLSNCGGVYLYYKCSLILKVIDVTYLQECINFEIKIYVKTCNFINLYKSHGQTKDEFENMNLRIS